MRRWLRPRYSLRLVLAVVTVAGLGLGVGLPIWQRPFEVEREVATSRWEEEGLPAAADQWERRYHLALHENDDAQIDSLQREDECNRFRYWMYGDRSLSEAAPPEYREVAQVYRDLRGNQVRHGPLTVRRLKDGTKLRVEHWRHGELHGKFTDWHPNGRVIIEGSYRHGRRHGDWLWYDVYREPAALERRKVYADGVLTRDVKYEDDRVVVEEYVDGAAAKHVERDKDGTRRCQWCLRDEERDGEATWWYPDGQRAEQVEYDAGRPLVARGWHPDGAKRYDGAFVDGLEQGRWTWWQADGTVRREVEFRAGRLVRQDGTLAPDLMDAPPESGSETRRILEKLDRPSAADLMDISLGEAADLWSDLHHTPIVLDRRRLAAAGLRLETTLVGCKPLPRGSDLRSDLQGVTLRAALQLTLEPLGLVAVHRHEMLVITTPESARDWRDGTGVGELMENGPVAIQRELEQPTQLDFIEVPLADALDFLSDLHGIRFMIDDAFEEEASRMELTVQLQGLSLASALTFLLDQYGLNCVCQGETIVIGRDGD